MKTLPIVLLLWVGVAAIGFADEDQKISSVEDALASDGQRVSMRGVVVEVVRLDNGYVYLNFGAPYPENSFAAVVHKMDADKFDDLDATKDRTVLVSGVSRVHDGRVSVRIRKPEDLVIVADAP